MGNNKDYSKILDSLKHEKLNEFNYKSFQSENDGGLDAHLNFWADDYKTRGDYDFKSKKDIDDQTVEEKENFAKKRKEFANDHLKKLVKSFNPEKYAEFQDEYAKSDTDESITMSAQIISGLYGLDMNNFKGHIDQFINQQFSKTGNPMEFINSVTAYLKHEDHGIMKNYSTRKLDHLLNDRESATEIIKIANEKYVKPTCEKGLSDARISYYAFDSSKAKKFLNTLINSPSDEYFRENGLKRIVNDTYNNGTKKAA